MKLWHELYSDRTGVFTRRGGAPGTPAQRKDSAQTQREGGPLCAGPGPQEKPNLLAPPSWTSGRQDREKNILLFAEAAESVGFIMAA